MRRSAKRAILVANKSESRAAAGRNAARPTSSVSATRLPISAEHGEGLADLYAALREALPDETERKDTLPEGKAVIARPAAQAPIRIAVVGRPNSGKSTLINRILGEERLLTGA